MSRIDREARKAWKVLRRLRTQCRKLTRKNEVAMRKLLEELK